MISGLGRKGSEIIKINWIKVFQAADSHGSYNNLDADKHRMVKLTEGNKLLTFVLLCSNTNRDNAISISNERRVSMATPEDTAVPKGGPREKELTGPKQEPVRAAAGDGTEQIVFTLRVPTGEVLKVERLDVGGNRRSLSKEEITGLVGKSEESEIEDALDEAFEAGICSLLDPRSQIEERPETGDEVALRRELLALIVGGGARRRLQRRIVQRLILTKTASR
jgi:hypothetical protein